jgi:hypothetical protein
VVISANILQQYNNVALPTNIVAKTWFHIATKSIMVAIL